MRALVVDDSSAMRSILRITLKGQGFEVLEAKHGRHALEVLSSADPVDVSFIDWNMPEMDGFELLQQIRHETKYDPMKIVMVTTETGATQMAEAISAGANEYIMKPFTLDVVIEKLRLTGL